MAALMRGLHVICEKPLALNSAQAREMAETAREKGVLGMANFPYREQSQCESVSATDPGEGYVGRILHVSGQYHGGFGLKLGAPAGLERGLTERSPAPAHPRRDLGSHRCTTSGALLLTHEGVHRRLCAIP